MNAIALPGAVALVGEHPLLGTKVPWSDSPEKRGGPWAPSTPLCSSQSCAVFCVWYLVRDLESCLGNVIRFVALGLLSSFGCPLSFGPVRSVFPPSLFFLLFVCCPPTSLSFSFSLFFSLDFSQALGKCKPCLVCNFPLCFFFLAAVFSLDPYFVLITFIKAPLPFVLRIVLFFSRSWLAPWWLWFVGCGLFSSLSLSLSISLYVLSLSLYVLSLSLFFSRPCLI